MTEANRRPGLDLWELLQLQDQLNGWTFLGQHHMHKSWQFLNSQKALEWYAMARELCEQHGHDCYFYLGHVGSGRIETDLLNHTEGHLTREELDVALMMNAIEEHLKDPAPKSDASYLCQSVQFLHRPQSSDDGAQFSSCPPEPSDHG